MELIDGMMEENILDIGKKIKCMEKVNLFGKMEVIIKVNILMILNKDMVSINKKMKKYLKEHGKMVFNKGQDKYEIIKIK